MPNTNLDCFRSYIERANELATLLSGGNVTTIHLLMAVVDLAGEELRGLLDEQLTTDILIEVYNLGGFSSEHPAVAREVLAAGLRARSRSSGTHEEAIYLLMGILALRTSLGFQILQSLQIQTDNLQAELARIIGLTSRSSRHRQAGQPVLSDVSETDETIAVPTVEITPLQPLRLANNSVLARAGKDITLLASQGKIDPVIGREKEIKKAMQVLLKRKKNNPVFIGEAGVGKTAVAEGIALVLAYNQEIPERLQGKRIFALSLSDITAGTQYRGQFEERLRRLVKELEDHSEVIIFIDELHTVLGAGSSEGGLDAANILKPALARGDFGCIGATTLDEYRKHIEKDAALERRFQPITIDEPNEDTTLCILKGLRTKYEHYHQVRYSDKALEAAVKLTARYIHERNFPDKAIDVLDEAGSREIMTAGSGTRIIDENDIAEIISEWTGIPVMTSDAQRERLLNIKKDLCQFIIGQVGAIELVGNRLLSLKMGNQPIGSFIFLGPTGVGKTEVARKLAYLLFGSEDALIKFDMSEYQEKHQVSRLIGAPPGYVGYEEGGELVERVRRKPYSVILFDEMEKAHVDMFDILLQVLEDGILTDNQGRRAYFENTIIIMTTNIRPSGRKSIGFSAGGEEAHDINLIHDALQKKGFRLEFINRVDETVLFQNLNKDDMSSILDLRLVEIIKKVQEDYGIKLSFTNSVKCQLVDKGFSAKLGARELKRTIQRLILSPLGQKCTSQEFQADDEVSVEIEKTEIKFRKIN